MRCKYCKEEIKLARNTWVDLGDIDPEMCTGIVGQFDHAPEDSASDLIEKIERKIIEARETFAEIEDLTAQLKEAR